MNQIGNLVRTAAEIHGWNEKLMKLHIGTGKNYLPGFTNIDIFSSVRADVFADMTALPFDRGSVDFIYACHVLEHAHRHMVLATLTHWHDLLKPCGVLRLSVPNFSACSAWYEKTGDLRSITGLLYGGQNHPKNNHFIIFDLATLTDDLKRVGFRSVNEWDWRSTEHAQFDDYASAYKPDFDKTGMLMSLNVQSIR